MNQKIIDFIKRFTSFIFSFTFLIGMIFLIWKVFIFSLDRISIFFKYIEDLYENGILPLPLIVLACTTFATITTAIITTLINKSNSLNLQIRTEQREKKALVYEELTEFFFKRIFASKTNADENLPSKEELEREVIGFLTSYTPK